MVVGCWYYRKDADKHVLQKKFVYDKKSERGIADMNKDSFSFVVYMIHACANHWKYNPSEVYKKMKSTDYIMGFLVPNYEILHTQSTQYIMEDIKEYLNVRGVSV